MFIFGYFVSYLFLVIENKLCKTNYLMKWSSLLFQYLVMTSKLMNQLKFKLEYINIYYIDLKSPFKLYFTLSFEAFS